MKSWLLSFSLLCAVAGCGGSSSTAKPIPEPTKQHQPGKYLFAAVYENHSWLHTQKGFVIKGNGDLYYFDLSDTTATLPAAEQASEAELTRFFEAARFEFVQTVPAEQLNQLWLQGRDLSNNTLGKEQSSCRDAGKYQYLMFQPVGNQQYRQALIYQTGDFRREQQDSKAELLKDYLVKQAVKLQIAYILDPDGNNWCSGL